MVSVDASAWRRRWRAIGLAADRLLPAGYNFPAPSSEQLLAKIPSYLIIPGKGNGRWTFSEEDKDLILDGVVFALGFVAESMPVQVVATDMKPQLPQVQRGAQTQDYRTAFYGFAKTSCTSFRSQDC